MKNKLLILLTLILSVFTLMGCKDNSDPNTIKIWWPSGITMETIITDAITNYKVDHPDVQIEVIYKPMDAFDAYKYALNDDRTRPDIAILDHVYIQALAFEGLLANLSSLGSEEIKTNYPDALYEANTYAGNAYALPFSANTVILMYNKDILKDSGVVDSEGNALPPTTLDELLLACQKIKAAGYTAFAQPLNDFSAMEFTSYVARRGGKLVSDDYQDILLNSEEVIRAVNDWVALSEYVNTSVYEEDKFYIGKVAFVEMGSWALSKVTGDSARFDAGFTEMVTVDSEYPNYSGLGLYSLCIAEKSTLKDEAYEFAKYLSLDLNVQLTFNQEKNLFPVTKEALQNEYYTSDEALGVYASQLLKVSARPGTPVWPDLELAIVDMLHSAVLADSPEAIITIINKYQKQAQEATDRLYK